MLYLYIEFDDQTSFPPLMSTWAEGSYAFPDEFLPEYYKEGKRAAGFVRVTHDETRVLSCLWDENAYQAWCKENPETDILPTLKEDRIQQSKTDLADYLESHPLLWTDGESYSITAEKQAQLTGKIMAATMAQTMSNPYTLTWNSTGEVCREWTLSDLSALAFAIDARVTSLVSYQQTQEVAIRNAATQEALDAIEVDYDSVG